MPLQAAFMPPTHMTPIPCPDCGASAHLMRRAPHLELKGELRTFECRGCGKEIRIAVED